MIRTKLAEQERRIKELEERVRQLEQRPYYMPYYCPPPIGIPNYPWPYAITYGSGTAPISGPT